MKSSPDLQTVKGRLQHFLRYKGISNSEFSRRMNLSVTYIGSMRESLPPRRIVELGRLFPELNRDWLLYGDGDMLISGNPESDTEPGYEVPLLPVQAYAGRLQNWSDGVSLRDCRKVVSPVSGVDFAIPVSGDSMEPEFHDGSTLLIKKINDRAFIPWGNPLVIDTENGVLVKCLYPGEGEYVEARSLNPAYPPITISRMTIFGIYRIVGSIKLYSNI